MKPAVLYLTRNGLLEPLGQSQAFSYLRGLSRDYAITLLTYEKDEDWADAARVAEARAQCEAHGIDWRPQRFRRNPRGLAPALSMLRMIWLAGREVRRKDVRLVHARSYIPAAVALIVGIWTRVPFIFDMRALWPEELITAGRLKRGSLLHRAIVAAERACLRHAAGVVSLTHAAVDHLQGLYPSELAGQRIVVIPTCADLARFVPADRPSPARIIGCLGTVLSGWFRLDWLTSFLRAAADRDPRARFEITTRDDARQIQSAFAGEPAVLQRLNIAPSSSDRVQDVIQRQLASVMFFTDGLGKLGSSPTRMAEILGCGIPVVANEGVGDVARIIRQYRVGVLARGPSREDMSAAWDELQVLLADPDLAARCRRCAEEVFSLESGTRAYAGLYANILSRAPFEAAASFVR